MTITIAQRMTVLQNIIINLTRCMSTQSVTRISLQQTPEHIRDFLTMRYINSLLLIFTHLLTYLLSLSL